MSDAIPAFGARELAAGPPESPALHAERVARGRGIYHTTCVVCHGESGQGGSHGGARLTSALTRESVATVIAYGRHDMPAFGASLEAGQLESLTDYVLELAAQHPAEQRP